MSLLHSPSSIAAHLEEVLRGELTRFPEGGAELLDVAGGDKPATFAWAYELRDPSDVSADHRAPHRECLHDHYGKSFRKARQNKASGFLELLADRAFIDPA